MKRTPLNRKKIESKNSKGLFDHITKEKKGLFDHLSKPSKDEEWKLVREELKPRFVRAGITSCEAELKGCIKSYNFGFGWTFAHSLKRMKITPEKVDRIKRAKEMREVIYCCVSCHQQLEAMIPDEMKNIIKTIISNRTINLNEL